MDIVDQAIEFKLKLVELGFESSVLAMDFSFATDLFVNRRKVYLYFTKSNSQKEPLLDFTILENHFRELGYEVISSPQMNKSAIYKSVCRVTYNHYPSFSLRITKCSS